MEVLVNDKKMLGIKKREGELNARAEKIANEISRLYGDINFCIDHHAVDINTEAFNDACKSAFWCKAIVSKYTPETFKELQDKALGRIEYERVMHGIKFEAPAQKKSKPTFIQQVKKLTGISKED